MSASQPDVPNQALKPPANPEAREIKNLLRLLDLEADLRRCESLRELFYHIANESRDVLGYRQAFVFSHRGRPKLEAVSSVASFEKDAPLNREITRAATRFFTGKSAAIQSFDLMREGGALADHAFRHALWLPFIAEDGRIFGGAILLKETEWNDRFIPLVERVRDAYAFAWRVLAGRSIRRRSSFSRHLVWPLALGVVMLLALVHAPLTVLAPVEVTSRETYAITSPIEGAIESVEVTPNAQVEAGALLIRLDDTELRNSLEIAESRVDVALAAFEKLQSASFTDRAAARDLKVAEAELGLARAERDLARERLSRVEITSPISGIAVFEDPRDLSGRPLLVGERIMDVIDPKVPELEIRLPVDDSIVLQSDARVRIFLDSDPLRPVEATLLRTSYHASAHEDGSFGYTLTAIPDDETAPFRIGSQGTAQIYGEDRSLFFILFRRPLSWLRQTFGV